MYRSSDDEIDLRDVFAALRRRWRWGVGGGFLGLTLAACVVSLDGQEVLRVRGSLIVDVAQGPCYFRMRQVQTFEDRSVLGITCTGEVETMRLRLDQFAKNSGLSRSDRVSKNTDLVIYDIDRFAFDSRGRDKSSTQLVLNVSAPADQIFEVSAALAQIQRQLSDAAAKEFKTSVDNIEYGSQWILLEKPAPLKLTGGRFSRPLALGLLVGIVMGAGGALIADRRSNRVYSQAELLRRLGHPLRLGLPSDSWTSSAVQVLVGQLATQLDHDLSWRVLSIARQHEAVVPITQLLQQQGGPELRCSNSDPLLSSVLRVDPRNQPTGLLLVVEAGFNSARALEEACLLISQMSNVRDVGVVLIGARLPEELRPSPAK